MIKNITIKGFKSFLNETIDLSDLTVLTGLNSSGKSSAIQALRMILLAKTGAPPYIKGFGGFDELKSKLSNMSDIIDISAITTSNESLSLKISKDTYTLDNNLNSEINFDYIGADRLGPSSTLPILSDENEHICIGENGQYCVDYFLNYENIIINEKLRHPNTTSHTLTHQLDAWMGEISPGVSLSFSKEKKHDISHIEIDKYRAANTGFGISYALPIVLSAMVMSSKNSGVEISNKIAQTWFDTNVATSPILLVENPEAHLHPQGQTSMGKLLALASSCGVQIVVETHSDHFLDGVRIQKKSESINHNSTKIYFFEKDTKGISQKTSIDIGNDGKLSKWPKGFFDQSMLNLRELSNQ